MAAPASIFTIGHSNHRLEDFLERLASADVRILADVRSFPASRKWPHFNRENLALSLPEHDVEYQWLATLGGRRSRGLGERSPNTAWTHPSFRNYADYMMTPPFAAGIGQLLALVQKERTCIMCAEVLYWRCHRRLISDYLLAHGIPVKHIMSNGSFRDHVLTPEARIQSDGRLIYPSANLDLFSGSAPSAG